MRATVQRVSMGSVTITGRDTVIIQKGMVVFVGITTPDNPNDVKWLADKIINLRIFEDSAGKMNLSLTDVSGEMLIVSQFTLYADCRKGRRPGFSSAAPPEIAEPLYDNFVGYVKKSGIKVATGIFQAEMQVKLVNDGPVTMLLDSHKLF